MRVVFDTVVFVRALISPYGACGRLIFEYADRYELVASEPIVREILAVLYRPEIARKYRAVASRDLAAITDLMGQLEIVEPAHVPPVCRDPEDDKFLAAARSARARFLVSEDKDLTDLGEYDGIRIVTCHDFLTALDGATRDMP